MSTTERSPALGEPSKGVKYGLLTLKVLELCLIILCIGLVDDPATNSQIRIFITQRTIGLCYATFGAFLLFTAVYLIMRLFGDICPWKTTALMSFIAISLFIACSIALLNDWTFVKERNYWPPNTQRLDLICATGFVSLIVAVLFLIDFIISVRYGLKEQLD